MGSHEQSPENNGSSTVSKKVADIWQRMNEGVPNKRVNFVSTALPAKNSANSNWKSYLGVNVKKKDTSVSDVQKSVLNHSCSEEAKSIAAAALAAVRNATVTAAAASSRGKIEITEVKDFAGQEIEVKRLVEADSKEALERGNKGSSSSSAAPSAVDAVLEHIKKKQKLSVLDKTKKDWGEYKEEHKGVEDELDKYKKSSDQYLDKVGFLERADYRQFEKERDARLALQSKRRHDDV
uniref:Bcnt-like protein n=1 Tax=Arabidopsis thaliana TaxID=3702 RepID=Q8L8Q4_ARATH|nr:bcnt-like protein [Arabidopsis thaliana]